MRGILVAGDVDERKALVVLEQDVVARLVPLHQVVLEQQRLGFRRRLGDLDARHLRDHRLGLVGVGAAAEVARHAIAQVPRLADVEDPAGRVEHAVHAGPRAARPSGTTAGRSSSGQALAPAPWPAPRPRGTWRGSGAACWCCNGCSGTSRPCAGRAASRCSAPCAKAWAESLQPRARSTAPCAIAPSASSTVPSASAASSAAR